MYIAVIFIHTRVLCSVYKYIPRKLQLNGLYAFSMHSCSGNYQEFQISLVGKNGGYIQCRASLSFMGNLIHSPISLPTH